MNNHIIFSNSVMESCKKRKPTAQSNHRAAKSSAPERVSSYCHCSRWPILVSGDIGLDSPMEALLVLSETK